MNTHKQIILALIGLIISGSLSLRADDDEGEEHERHENRQSVSEQSKSQYTLARQIPAVDNKKWQAECSSCHMLYLPGLLPERSWTKMMNDLDNHFGENASLDEATKKEVTNFLVTNSADRANSRRGLKILSSIAANQAPLRISETSYFIRKHHEIQADVYKRKAIGSAANCISCHSGAEKGDFQEENVKIPKATALAPTKKDVVKVHDGAKK
jgi:nitrate/TMAO reductase-like tetraheme cytochrome c subunit